MLPCAHRVCCKCSLALQERLPAAQPQAARRISCPTCRAPAAVRDLVYVDARLASPGGKGAGASGSQRERQQARQQEEEEAAIAVRGSYGTKASRASLSPAPALAQAALPPAPCPARPAHTRAPLARPRSWRRWCGACCG